MGLSLRVLCLVAMAVFMSTLPTSAADRVAQATKPPAGIKLPKSKSTKSPVPLKPQTDAQKKHQQALALFMSGKLREAKNDFRGAYADYQKAITIEPNAVVVYRSLVPLAFGLGKQDDAVKYAFKAIELDPDDYSLLRQLGVFMAAQNKIDQATKLLERATKSKTLKHDTVIYVTLKRDLAILYSGKLATDKTNTALKKKVADAYQVVFEARTNPKKFQLDATTSRRLSRDPVSSFEKIGQAFLAAGRSTLAIRAYEAAQKEGKGRPGSLSYNLARVYFQTKQFDKSLEHLQKYFDAQLQTKGRAAYELLADILKEQGRTKSLVGRLELLAKNDSRNGTLQYYLAEKYVAAKQFDKAEKLYLATLKIDDTPMGHLGLAGVQRERGKADAWLSEIKLVLGAANTPDKLEANLDNLAAEFTAAAKNKKFAAGVIAKGEKRIGDKKNPLGLHESVILAQLAAEAKKTKPAVKFYEHALKTAPQMAGIIYGQMGGHLLDVSEYADAAKVFQKAVNDPALSRGKPNFLFRLSQAEEMAGNTAAAISAIKQAQNVLPGVGLLHYQEGWIYYHARQYAKAIPIFENVISKFPTDGSIIKQCRFSLSNIYVQTGNRDKGEKVLEEIYQENPDDPSVNNDLGYLWAERGKNLRQAEKMIRKALAADPDNAAYQDSMGWVLYMRKKYTEALPYLKKSANDPSGGDATIWDHLGDCYDKLKKPADAEKSWKKALKDARKSKNPDKKLIKKIEAKLKPGA